MYFFRASQASVLAPVSSVLFFVTDIMSDIDLASYADDSTPYVEAGSIEDVIRKLENDSI